MFGQQRQVGVHGPRRHGARPLAAQHVQKVGGVAQRGVGRDRFQPSIAALDRGQRDGHQGGQPHADAPHVVGV